MEVTLNRERTLALYRQELGSEHSHTMNSFAWMLATASDVKVRDPQRAVALAKEVVKHFPTEGDKWSTLGIAYYRSGDWNNAIQSLAKSEELAPGQFLGHNALFLAMAHRQRKEPENARQWYDRAIRWIEKNKPNDADIPQFRAEAAQLLGLVDATLPRKKTGQ